ncbi:hypothetical protein GQ600_3297 [Phytophthora cactorum]|nr:hypothetical protein GQ600_3297 [Phytophthora cactorum]
MSSVQRAWLPSTQRQDLYCAVVRTKLAAANSHTFVFKGKIHRSCLSRTFRAPSNRSCRLHSASQASRSRPALQACVEGVENQRMDM